MKKLQRITRVNELRKGEERTAGRVLAEAKQDRAAREQLLNQLLAYRREYQQLFSEQSARGLDVQQYRNFQEFFLQLDQAVAEQQKALQEGEVNVTRSRDQWLGKKNRTESLSKLRRGLEREAACLEQKQEQKQNDERYAGSKNPGVA